MVNKLLSLTIFINVTLINCRVDPSIISGYFKAKLISRITILACWETSQSATIMKALSKEGIRVSFSHKSIPYFTDLRDGGVLDLSCYNSERFLTKINKEKSFSASAEWLLLDFSPEANSLQYTAGIDSLKTTYILPGSCVTLAQIASDRVYYYDVYRISTKTPLKFDLLALQEIGDDLVLKPREDRSDFEQVTMETATVVYRPELFKGLEDLDRPEVDTWPKIHYPVLKTLADQLNFKYNVIISDDYGWNVSGRFNGLIGMIERDEIDFGAAGAFMREDRMRVSDFTFNIFQVGSALLFKQPTLSSVSNIYVLPFTKPVWIACVALTVLVIILLCVELIIAKYRTIPAYSTDVTFVDMATIILGLVCQQGTNLNPTAVPARIMLFIFSLSAIFFYTSYSANIVALLQSTTPVIKTLNDLTNSHLGIRVLDQTYNYVYFYEAVDPNIINLYNKKVKPFGKKAFLEPNEGIRLMRTGEYAYNVDVNIGYKVISDTFAEKEKCGLSALKMFNTPAVAIPIIKKSGYKELLQQKICRQREVGIIHRIAKIWIPSKPPCNSKGRGYLSVGLTDFLPTLFAFIYGTVITVMIFIIELIVYTRNNWIKGNRLIIRNLLRKRKHLKITNFNN